MGEIWDKFNAVCPNHPNTVNGFHVALKELIACYVHPMDIADQQRYLETGKKWYSLNSQELESHLKLINKLVSLWPNQAGNRPFNAWG